ncbi:tetratricopeptide repeat protein [Neolewinella aurantiaca]|uniref:Tetratricopeptide repeat protein n=1 Tax=Neolewinella aurantiaca TaxID=2602767 RepID=A0A5C7FWE0_9BACT|nr:histidine kinase [Neolewinella aurantiaca]TXF89951.1 tetratricopeptide repeat protein [Neolewinella aurantiaca]
MSLIKTDLRKRRLLPGFFVLPGVVILLFFLLGCESEGAEDQVVSSGGPSFDQEVTRKIPVEFLTDTAGYGEKVRELMPVLRSDPATRELEVWYDRKDSLITEMGGMEEFADYINGLASIALDNKDFEDAAKLKNALARIIYLKGDYPEALQLYNDAFEIAKSQGDSKMMCWNLLGQANTLIRFHDFDQAVIHFDQAEKLVNKLKEPSISSHLLLTGAILEFSTGTVDSAIYFAEGALRLAREEKLGELEKYSLSNLSYLYISQKKYEQAIELLVERELPASDELTISTAMINFNLYEAYLGKKNYTKAYACLMEGCQVSDSLRFAFGISFCRKSLSEYYEEVGDNEKALAYFKEYHTINEEQTGLKAKSEIQSIRAKQALREKDWEIERLLLVEEEQKQTLLNRRRAMYNVVIGLVVFFGILFLLISARSRVNIANKNRVIAETKVRLLKSQMNPHFLFNAITGIQNFILKSKKMDAYNYLGKFSDLLRTIAQSSTTGSIALNKEIGLIETYLELEKLRFRDSFVFELNVADSLRDLDVEIPSMMVQPIVENAIQHGLTGLSYQGVLTVSFKPFENCIECVVEDNGRGRAAAGGARLQAGRHLSISTSNTQETLKYLQALGYTSARLFIEDLHHPDGTAAGTRARIYLPFLN